MTAAISLFTLVLVAIEVVFFVAVNSEGHGRLERLRRRIFESPTKGLAPIEDRAAARKSLEDQYR